MTIKHAVWSWSVEFQYIFLKGREAFRIPYTLSRLYVFFCKQPNVLVKPLVAKDNP